MNDFTTEQPSQFGVRITEIQGQEQTMNTKIRWMPLCFVLAVVCMGVVLTSAQVKTETTATSGNLAAQEVTVDRGEVVRVSGNDLWLKMPDGEIRHIADVPEGARATVDGKEVGIHDLQPGTILQRTITTTAIPMTLTTVESVTGTVFYVEPPNSVILTLQNGQNQEFKIPKGQEFMINGQETDAWGLKKRHESHRHQDRRRTRDPVRTAEASKGYTATSACSACGCGDLDHQP
jgi:hypothetical protein